MSRPALQPHCKDARVFWERTFARDATNAWTHRRKVAALDIGSRRIGIALSDDAQEIALPFGVLHVRPRGAALALADTDRTLARTLCAENIAGWIVGWPLDLLGRASASTRRTLHVLEQLQQLLGVPLAPILLHDERFSTTLARADLLDQPPGAAIGLDALAAARILQEYLYMSCRFSTHHHY